MKRRRSQDRKPLAFRKSRDASFSILCLHLWLLRHHAAVQTLRLCIKLITNLISEEKWLVWCERTWVPKSKEFGIRHAQFGFLTPKLAIPGYIFGQKWAFFDMARATFCRGPHQISKKTSFFKNFSKISPKSRVIGHFLKKMFPVTFFP